MENKIEKALSFYNKANDLKYNKHAFNGTRMISMADNIFEKYSIAVGNYLESEDDYSLGELIRFLTVVFLYNSVEKLNDETNLKVINDYFEPNTRENSIGDDVFKNSMYVMLKKPINKQSKFVLENIKLMNKTRTGHIYWGVNTKRKENIGEHVFGTCALAIALDSVYKVGSEIDMNKVLSMLAVHETEEIVIGDTTEFDTNPQDKLEEGKKAVHRLLMGYKKGPEIEKLLDEFNERKTPESQFAYLCDKMEYILQVKKYEELGLYNFEKRPQNCCTESSRVKEIINNGASSVFEVHADYDDYRFENNDMFKNLLAYLKTNNLSTFDSRKDAVKLIKKCVNNF